MSLTHQKSRWLLLAILILGVALRIFQLGEESFWYDETTTFRMADAPVIDVITNRAHDISNAPLYFVVFHYWIRILDSRSEVAARSFSVLLGVLGIWCTYLIGKHWFSERIGLVAALILAFSPQHVYFSQEARTYALIIFLTALSFYFFRRLIHSTATTNVLGYILTTVTLLYAHNYAVLVVIVQVLFVIVQPIGGWKEKLKYLWAVVLAGILYLPWVPVFLQQVGHRYDSPEIGSYVRMNWYEHVLALPYYLTVGRTLAWREEGVLIFIAAVGVVAGALVLPVWQGLKVARRMEPLILFWLIGIPFLALLITVAMVPIFSTLYLCILLPSFALVLALGLVALYDHKRKIIFYAHACLLMIVVGLSLIRLYTLPQKQDWRGATAFIGEHLGGEEAVVFSPGYVSTPFKYYNQKPAQEIPLMVPAGDGEWRTAPNGEPLIRQISVLPGIWLLAFNQPRYASPDLLAQLQHLFPFQQEHSFYKVKLIHFWK